jgi:hypothetical protein
VGLAVPKAYHRWIARAEVGRRLPAARNRAVLHAVFEAIMQRGCDVSDDGTMHPLTYAGVRGNKTAA